MRLQSDAHGHVKSVREEEECLPTNPAKIYTICMVRIKAFSWGEIVLEDGTIYKDAIITSDGATEWDWGLDGTCHDPGISAKAVSHVFDYPYVILSLGVNSLLKVTPKARKYLKGCTVMAMPSDRAWVHYNAFIDDGFRAAILLHSTC